jgi:formylglycine-generating enzyme required for sulfatase activity
MIPLRCGHCGKDLKVRDELAGKKVRCPSCQKAVAVPQPSSISPPPTAGGKGANLEEERTLPPSTPAGGSSPESLADAVGRTDLGGRKGEQTQASPDEGPSPELTDFLAPAEKPDELGRLGGFRILKVLGHGGMGVVFQGEDLKLGRKVAIKAMLPHLAQSKTSHERFLREAKAAAALEHDHIVPIFHVGEDRGAPFIVMPFLQGEPLDARLKRDTALPMAEVIRIGRETAEGLAAAHARGLIHRDIKPANIWLEERGAPSGERGAQSAEREESAGRASRSALRAPRAKILDFGLARAAGDTGLTQTGAIIGTPQYMAPEQAAGRKDIDHRCDLFSLGCVLYRMCTGQTPFKGEDTLAIISALAMEQPREPNKIKKEVPAGLSNLIMHLLAKKPDDRPQSAQEVADALAELSAKDTAMMPAPKGGKTTLLRPPKSLASRRKWVVGAAALVLLLAVGGLVLILNSGKTDPNQNAKNKGQGDEPLPPTFTNTLGMEFILIPKGKSWLAGGGGKPGTKEVEIAHDFYLGKYEVTQEEWEKVFGVNPSQFKAVQGINKEEQKRFPVEQVSWDDCQLFIKGLNDQAKETGWLYRLPTEVEWEYACRGGPMKDKFESAFDYYLEKPTNTLLPDQANLGNVLKRTCKVGSYKPNRLGLYDMHGNVWEWCQDEVKGDKGASQRVFRGGGWLNDAGGCRAAYRDTYPPSNRHYNLALRLARVPVGKEIVKIPAEEKKPPPEAKLPPIFTTMGMEFVLVPKGKSWLGGGGGKPGTREVEITHDFYLGRYEVTQGDWKRLMAKNPSQFSRTGEKSDEVKNLSEDELNRFPVENVAWDDCQQFIARLNAELKEGGWVYRLPTEVEWEYACRGGPMKDAAQSAFHFYLDKPANVLSPQQANIQDGKSKRPCKVTSYKPNRLGLYDMHGNVWEWCADSIPDPKDPKLPRRVQRGGGWNNNADYARATARYVCPPSHHHGVIGLRLARVPAGKEIVKILAEEKKPPPEAKLPPTFKNDLGIEFVLVPKGMSWLGGGGNPGTKEVEIAHDFYLGKYQVTQEEWEKVLGDNPSTFKSVAGVPMADMKRFPVETVSWEDAQKFLKALNEKVKEAGWVYRLPREVEWEYACRCGPMTEEDHRSISAFDYYLEKPTSQLLPGKANFEHVKALKRPCKVGSYPPNRLGLHDMHGNVWQWCDEVEKAGDGTLTGVVRGGGWRSDSASCRAGFRLTGPALGRHDSNGLRVARIPVGK